MTLKTIACMVWLGSDFTSSAAPVTVPCLGAEDGGQTTPKTNASPIIGDGGSKSVETDTIRTAIPAITTAHSRDNPTLDESASQTGIIACSPDTPSIHAGPRVFGIDFNRTDTLGSPSQAMFRVIGGSQTQANNAAKYVKHIGTIQAAITQPGGDMFEFRGANGDGTRAIPGGATSRSFLVADFIATRKGGIDIGITGLAAGTYIFRSYHLDSLTLPKLGFAQGATTKTPNIIEARLGGTVRASVKPTVLGSSGLNTTFISDAQIPTLNFPFNHNGSSQLVIELRSTIPNGKENFLILNGFEILRSNP